MDYTASPLGSFPELAKMYSSSFQAPISNSMAAADSQNTQTAVANAKAAAEVAKQKAAAFSDPSKYSVVQRPDGGYGFYGPDGKEVSASQYAQISGKLPSDVLKDSQNPVDIQYIQDAKDLAAYYKAKAQSSDPKQKAIAQQIESQVKKNYGLDLANTPHQDVLKAFYSNYPTVYGGNTPGQSGTNLLIPTYGGAQAQAEANHPLGFYSYGGGGNKIGQ